MNTNNTPGNIPPFAIGQMVVCINDAANLNHPMIEHCIPVFPIKKGVVYTVIGLRYGILSGWYLALKEVTHEPTSWGFHQSRFAPIEENKERIRYVAVSETLRERAEEVIVESCNLS